MYNVENIIFIENYKNFINRHKKKMPLKMTKRAHSTWNVRFIPVRFEYKI